MRWKRAKKQSVPMAPGRDRTSRVQNRPMYSYYSGSQPKTPEARGRGVRSSQATPRVPRSPLHTIMLVACILVGLVCAVKILTLSADSKIVIAENQQSLQLPSASYAEVVNDSLGSSLLNANKITLNTKGVARDLQKKFPELSSVVVTVPLVGNRPVVYVRPSLASFMIESSGVFYTMADTGYILAQLSVPQDGLTTLNELSQRQPRVGEQFLPASTVVFAKAVTYQLNQSGLAVARVELPANAPYELRVRLVDKPYYLRFNLQADVMQQSGGAVAALRKISGTQPPREYVDLRVLGRVYYK